MDMALRRGYIGVFGPAVDTIAKVGLASVAILPFDFKSSPGPYHITLVTKDELRRLKPGIGDPLSSLKSCLKASHQVYTLGVGGRMHKSTTVLFVVVIWNVAQQVRKSLGLPPKQLHVTLTSEDDHVMDKGIDSLMHGQFPENPSLALLDHLALTLMYERNLNRAHEISVKMCARYPGNEKGWIRLGDIATKEGRWKLAMLAYGKALDLSTVSSTVEHYCIGNIWEIALRGTEWGPIFLEDEESQIPSELTTYLWSPWSQRTKRVLSYAPKEDLNPTLTIDSRIRLRIQWPPPASQEPSLTTFELPRFFRWIVPFHLALMSTPRHADDIAALASPAIGIKHILTLTEETPLPQSWFEGTAVTHTFLPIPNYHAPSIEQMDAILRLFTDDNKVPILVHCGGGKGRAGTVAACYIAAYGFTRPHTFDQTQPLMSASQAIAAVRLVRPGSIETQQQEEFIKDWISAVWKRQVVLPPLLPEAPPCPIDNEGEVNSEADLLILVGLPGSGKSWFSAAIAARSAQWRVISQDESFSRSTCETDISRRGGKVILDRCNTTQEDRKIWLFLATWAKHAVAIFFDFSPELCTSRAQQRLEHPTLPPGNRVRNAIQSRISTLTPPSLQEGFKGIATVKSFQAARELVQIIAPAQLLKFPRTAHLIDLGAVTDDDLTTSLSNLFVSKGLGSPMNDANITEKIDGANLGFSLDADRNLVVQNRSHYVNSKTHEQFKKLDLWIESHREDLYAVLDRDPNFPERYILYGEWMAAKHSIAYTSLSDWFVAFDFYDRFYGYFVSRPNMEALLKPTTIQLTPILWKGKESELPNEAALRAMVELTSKYYDGRVEGVYVKVERDGNVLRRGKVVRGDFIAGNEHWTRSKIEWNKLVEQKFE